MCLALNKFLPALTPTVYPNWCPLSHPDIARYSLTTDALSLDIIIIEKYSNTNLFGLQKCVIVNKHLHEGQIKRHLGVLSFISYLATTAYFKWG